VLCNNKDVNKIILVTTNNRKLKEAKLGCAIYNIEVEQANYEFDEI
jgi:inosine/xanthosine triphosphate pyrophosphatase family protein